MANIANPLPYITKREQGIVPDLKFALFEHRLNAAKNLYRKDLKCHYGCVNAIEFSSNGELLISGGDDRRVVLWQFGQAVVGQGRPEAMKSVHQSNIFCLGITNDSKKIYSGGNDDMVIAHDVETKRAIEVLSHHRAVCCLSIDPYNDRIVCTAGNDGRLLLFDTRQSVHESLVISRSRKSFHGVMFHPSQKDILVSANARDGVGLWDLKMPKRPVIRYAGNNGPYQNCMSVRFNSAGTHVLALRRRLPPVLYALYEQEPRAEFYHQDYYNSCTMKSCSFAGEGDRYVLSGSDDFNLYLWKVPEPGTEDVVVENPHIVLYGHRSIVNQVRFNSQYSLIASSGVEKIIKLWSTMKYPSMRGDLLESVTGSDNPREIYGQDDYLNLMHGMPGEFASINEQSTNEDPRMMAFFDSLVQRELECLDESSSSDTLDYSDSPDAHILAGFLPLVLPPKIRISNSANRSQRGPNRLARIVASRYPNNVREAQKRGTLRRSKHLDRRPLLTKFKMLPTRASAKGKQRSSGASRSAPRGLENRPGSRWSTAATVGSASPVSSERDDDEPRACRAAARRSNRPGSRWSTAATVGSASPVSSERDDDEPRACRAAARRSNLRSLRRRMNLSRASKRKNKATNTSYRKSVVNLRSTGFTQDSDIIPLSSRANYLDGLDTMTLPSTSTAVPAVAGDPEGSCFGKMTLKSNRVPPYLDYPDSTPKPSTAPTLGRDPGERYYGGLSLLPNLANDNDRPETMTLPRTSTVQVNEGRPVASLSGGPPMLSNRTGYADDLHLTLPITSTAPAVAGDAEGSCFGKMTLKSNRVPPYLDYPDSTPKPSTAPTLGRGPGERYYGGLSLLPNLANDNDRPETMTLPRTSTVQVNEGRPVASLSGGPPMLSNRTGYADDLHLTLPITSTAAPAVAGDPEGSCFGKMTFKPNRVPPYLDYPDSTPKPSTAPTLGRGPGERYYGGLSLLPNLANDVDGPETMTLPRTSTVQVNEGRPVASISREPPTLSNRAGYADGLDLTLPSTSTAPAVPGYLGWSYFGKMIPQSNRVPYVDYPDMSSTPNTVPAVGGHPAWSYLGKMTPQSHRVPYVDNPDMTSEPRQPSTVQVNEGQPVTSRSEGPPMLSNRGGYADGRDLMTIPSTSTGYRGENTTTTFRVAADSDDQYGSGSSSPNCGGPRPHVSIVGLVGTHRMKDMHEDTQTDSLIVVPPESDSTPPPSETRHRSVRKGRRIGRSLKRSDSSDTPAPKEHSEDSIIPDRLSPKEYSNGTVARLMNETNESELESSCSTEGSAWRSRGAAGGGTGGAGAGTPGAFTPDSGVGTAGAGSSGRRAPPAGDVSDDQDWQALKLRQRIKKARRNYRKHMDSDSN